MRFKIKLREPVNGLTHLGGALLAITGTVMLIYPAAKVGNILQVVAFSIYGASLILLYTASTLYHLLPVSERGVAVLRRIDHMMIYILIAGTYTPICLIPLHGPWGWSLLASIWGIAVAGIILKLYWLQAPRWLSTGIYLFAGWLAIVAFVPLVRALPLAAIGWLLLGGVFYNVGAIIYGTKRPNPFPGVFGFHEIWHLFVIAGSFGHFYLMWRYVLPMP